MIRITFLLILAAMVTVVVAFMLPVLAFLTGLGAIVGLLVFLRKALKDDDQDLSHPG